jgi:DNA-directed RNA polymerase alpha subunit
MPELRCCYGRAICGSSESNESSGTPQSCVAQAQEEVMDGDRDWDREPISALCLAIRASWCLDVSGISTVGELCRWSSAELLAIQHFGKTSLVEVRARLAEHGLALRGEGTPEVGPDIVVNAEPDTTADQPRE